jgi:hypothetical protein
MVVYEQKSESKIALLICGRIKYSWKFSLEKNLKYIINKLNPIIFVSTYSLENDISDLENFAEAYGIPFESSRFNIETFIIENKEHSLYKNKGIHPLLVDIYPKLLVDEHMNEDSYYRYASSFFHNYSAYNLMLSYSKENDITFDYVIKYRCDILPSDFLPVDSFNCDDTTIMIPKEFSANENWCEDHLAIGTMKSMSKYCNIFANLEEYYDKYMIDLFVPEIALHKHLMAEDIKHKETEKEFKYELIRHYDKTHIYYEKYNARYEILKQKYIEDKLNQVKPNIALLFTGRIKYSWSEGLENIMKFLINKYNPIIFVSTYTLDNDISDLKKFAEAYNIQFIPEFFNIETLEIENKEHPLYKNKGIYHFDTEDPNIIKHRDHIINTNAYYRYCSMFFHNFRAYSLMSDYSIKNNIHFDYVIKWRPDFVPTSDISEDSFVLNDKVISVPNNKSYSEEYWCQDHIAIGTVKSMFIYCNIFNMLEEIYVKYMIDLYLPEKTLGRYLELENITIKYSDNPLTFYQTRVYDKTSGQK